MTCGSTCICCSSCCCAVASSEAASLESMARGAAVPRHMRPPLGLPPPPVRVPASLIISPCTHPCVSWNDSTRPEAGVALQTILVLSSELQLRCRSVECEKLEHLILVQTCSSSEANHQHRQMQQTMLYASLKSFAGPEEVWLCQAQHPGLECNICTDKQCLAWQSVKGCNAYDAHSRCEESMADADSADLLEATFCSSGQEPLLASFAPVLCRLCLKVGSC